MAIARVEHVVTAQARQRVVALAALQVVAVAVAGQ
jgi:hypothetical protein